LCIVFKILVCNSLEAAKSTLAVAMGAILKTTWQSSSHVQV